MRDPVMDIVEQAQEHGLDERLCDPEFYVGILYALAVLPATENVTICGQTRLARFDVIPDAIELLVHMGLLQRTEHKPVCDCCIGQPELTPTEAGAYYVHQWISTARS